MRTSNFKFPLSTLSGSTLGNLRELLHEHKVAKGYRAKFRMSAAVAVLLSPFTIAERLIWKKKLSKIQPESPPIFIIGFWRSGTTLLHNLLSQDPQAAYTTTFQTVFPNLALTTSWWLKPIINRFMPTHRPLDHVRMDMDFPQEEDFGMMNIQTSTIYKFFLFPEDYEKILENELFTARLEPKKLEKWKSAYKMMIAKALVNSSGKRYVGKNPCHLTRIELIREMYPEAKFIFIHRHPCHVIESLYNFAMSVFSGVQLQDVPPEFTRESVAILYNKIISAYLSERDSIPPANLIEMRMEEFTKDIHGHLKCIYERFDLGDYSLVEPYINKYLYENPHPEKKRSPAGPEIPRLAKKYASDIMKTLGYQFTEIMENYQPGVSGSLNFDP